MYHRDTTKPVKVVINQDDEFYFVMVDGEYIGSMVHDDKADFGFEAEETALIPYLEGISGHFKEQCEKSDFECTLTVVHGDKIVSTLFINDETLEVAISPETNLEEFAAKIQESIYDIVSFETRLHVILSKEGDDSTIEIGIN